MGLDWSHEISFSGLRKKATRKTKDEYPSKRYMNMMAPDAQERSVRRVSLMTVPLVISFVLFAKFGIYEPYHKVYLRTQEFSQLTDEFTELERQLANYDEVLEEYRMYDAIRITSEATDVAAVDALNLVDNYVRSVGSVYFISLNNGVLTIQLSDATLDGIGGLVKTLNELDIVQSVEVKNAANNNEVKQTRVTIIITLRSQATADAAASAVSE